MFIIILEVAVYVNWSASLCTADKKRDGSLSIVVAFSFAVIFIYQALSISITTTALSFIVFDVARNERRYMFYPLLVIVDLKQRQLPRSGDGHLLLWRRIDY